MEKVKELFKKLNLKVAMVGGALVLTTSLGTCHFVDSAEEASEPDPVEEAPAEEAAAEEELPSEEAAPDVE